MACKQADLDYAIRTQSKDTHAKLAVVLDSFFIVFLDIVREIVNRDVVMFDIFHYLAKGKS